MDHLQKLYKPQVKSEYVIDSHGNDCYKVLVGGLHTYVGSAHLTEPAINRLTSLHESKISALVDSYVEVVYKVIARSKTPT
jgi:hypothetical protein